MRSIDVFGIHFTLTAQDACAGLPMYLVFGREFFVARGNGIDFVVVELSKSDRFGVIALKKQLLEYELAFHMPTAYYFEELTSRQRDSLIVQNIPFISEKKQIYLPFLGIALSKTVRKDKDINADRMMPATQSLFLYLLYKCGSAPITKKNAAAALGITRTSITRASNQLRAMGLTTEETRGKEIYIWAKEQGYSYFSMAKPFLINPVRCTVCVENADWLSTLPLAGDSALSAKTMLSPSRTRCVATEKKQAGNITVLDEQWAAGEDLVNLELWKYDPALFAADGVVDPVSLYMSFEGNHDERIESSVEELMENYIW